MATKTTPAKPALKPDLTAFYRLSRPKRKPCSVGIILSTIKGQDLVDLEAALKIDGGIIPPGAIVEWVDLLKIGMETTATSVSNHRTRKCSCAKD